MAGPCIADTDTIVLSVPDGATLQADARVSADYDNGLERSGSGDGFWVPGHQVVSGFPGSPLVYDSQIVFRQLASGVMAMYRYNAGASGSYKWEFIGGAGVMINDATEFDVTTSGSPSGNWVDGGGQKLQLATPHSGVWEIYHEALIATPAGSGSAAIGVGIAGADPTSLLIGYNNTTGGTTISVTHQIALTSGQLVKQMFLNTIPSSTVAWSRRKLMMTPVRGI